MADDDQLDQDEIERLLSQTRGDAPSDEQPAAEEPAAEAEDDAALGQAEIEAMLNGGASAAAPAAATPTPPETPEDDAAGLDQGAIESLLQNTGGQPAANPAAPAQPPPVQPAAAPPNEAAVGQSDIELLMNSAQQALSSVTDEPNALQAGISPFNLSEFSGTPPSNEAATIQLISDVELDLKIELGRTHMYVEDVLKLKKGSVVPLDKLAGDPVDIYVNGRLVARGEVLVMNDNFCIRVGELIASEGANVA